MPTANAGKLASLRNDPKGWLILLIGLGAPIAFVIAAGGAGMGLWGFQAGLGAVPFILAAALGALIIAAFGIFRDRRKARKTPWLRLAIGSIAAIGFLGYMTSYLVPMLTLPAIHDISTDLADPPRFTALPLRPDNLDNIPGADDADMRGMNPRQRWAVLHQEAFADIRTVRIDQPVPQVIARAERLANDRGWDIARVDPAAGSLEATDTVSLFRFKDDVVIRARPTADGAASIIDMRSVSRVGVHDLGVNSARVRSFLSDLSGTTSAASR
ncbi:MAG: DUF1499 domain-containing protein [Parasphingorhabdus sp.]|nr:DUF1499 domain-containing protein [Parasphingorhabdus sp.]